MFETTRLLSLYFQIKCIQLMQIYSCYMNLEALEIIIQEIQQIQTRAVN